MIHSHLTQLVKLLSSIFTHPKLWMGTFILWLVTLCVLSSFSPNLPQETPDIPHLDKVAHFGYFLGGGIILTTWLLLKYGTQKSFIVRYILPILFFTIFGAIDEYRQTFTPGRSGNDLYDWLADVLGATCGIFIANHAHHLLLRFSSSTRSFSEN